MKDDKLKPCPVCGSKSEHSNRRESSSCTNSDCFLSKRWVPDIQWNTRTEPKEQWISVKDSMPKERVDVRVLQENDIESWQNVAHLVDSEYFMNDLSEYPLDHVTHWMPIKESSNEK